MKPSVGTRKPYNGSTRSMVLALDIGTTFSGVSNTQLLGGRKSMGHIESPEYSVLAMRKENLLGSNLKRTYRLVRMSRVTMVTVTLLRLVGIASACNVAGYFLLNFPLL